MNNHLPKIAPFLCAISVLGVGHAARAASAKTPTAHQLVEQSIKTYQSLDSYQYTSVKSSISPAGKQVSRSLISWKAPRYLNIVTTVEDRQLRENYDGTHYNFTGVDETGEFWSNEPLPDTSFGRKVLLQYQPTGMLFTPFLAGVNPFQEPFGFPMSSVTLKSPSTLGGVKVDTIVAIPTADPNTQFTYLIGQKDHLIRRISMQSVTVAGDKYQISETHSDIKMNVTFAPETFTFHAPAKATLKHPMTDAIGETLKTGDTPPAINATDIKGNAATLEKYKGKVLLLDFWASWCGPCVREMPFIKSLYQKYHNQGFEILGVSQDETLDDLNKYITDESLPWQQVFDGDGKTSEPYNVMYIPYSVLIGRDGKVISVNQKRLLLDSAIRDALKQ